MTKYILRDHTPRTGCLNCKLVVSRATSESLYLSPLNPTLTVKREISYRHQGHRPWLLSLCPPLDVGSVTGSLLLRQQRLPLHLLNCQLQNHTHTHCN